MDTPQIIVIVAAIVALGFSIWAFVRSGRTITLEGVQEIARDTSSLASELQQVAAVAVASAQQLKESGQIADDDINDAAFKHAVEHIEKWYNSVAPDIVLDPDVVENAIEGAYYWLKRAQPPVDLGANRVNWNS